MLSITYFFTRGVESAFDGWSQLLRCVGLAYNGVAEGAGSDPTDYFLEFVGVDTETVECARLGKFAVRSV